MNEKEKAAESLEVIRSLMERATVYRAISGPTALFAGLLALVMGFGGVVKMEHLLNLHWHQIWYVVLGLVVIFNTVLIVRKSQREKKPLFSPGLKAACRAIVPPLVVGFVGGQVLVEAKLYPYIPAVWMSCYGLALMSTGSFSPRSIWNLGAAFVVMGIFVALFPMTGISLLDNRIMGVTFGGFHLIYGALVTVSKKDRS